MADPLVGRTIGGVEIDARLGAGGMASVYAGIDEAGIDGAGEGRPRRALKLLSITCHEAYRDRFEREAQIGSSLRHPLLVGVHRHGVSGDFHFMVMDLVEGEDLARVLRRGALPWPAVAALGRDVAEALAALHEAGVIHRDLKPANVLLDARGRLKLADFGLARWREAPSDLPTEAPLTATGDAFGTPVYMAPEQFLDAKQAGPAADLYALGVLLFEALSGRPPFAASSPGELARLHRGVAAPSLEALAGDAPQALRALIERLLEKHPSDRPRDASEVARVCAELAIQGGCEPIPLQPAPGAVSGETALRWDPQRRASTASILPGVRRAAAVTSTEDKATSVARGGTTRPPAHLGRRRRRALVGVAAGLALLGGLGATWRWPPARLLLASPEERSRYEAIRAARAQVGRDPKPLVLAIESYLRDFSDSGWLRDEVETLRSRPLQVRANVFLVAADQAEMLHVPAGAYTVGREGGDDERASARREVASGGFLIDRSEVSNRRYERFLAEWRKAGAVHRCGREDLDHAPAPGSKLISTDSLGPAVGLSAWDALEYARFYGRRLPSEDEWEVAASWDPQAARARPYPWGDREPSAQDAYLANLAFAEYGVVDVDTGDFRLGCAPSGTFELDRSGFGLLDVAGNAAEWCAGRLPLPGRQPIRGGSYRTSDPSAARLSARRELDPAGAEGEVLGFRTVLVFEGE